MFKQQLGGIVNDHEEAMKMITESKILSEIPNVLDLLADEFFKGGPDAVGRYLKEAGLKEDLAGQVMKGLGYASFEIFKGFINGKVIDE
jgi:hypothetical protein